MSDALISEEVPILQDEVLCREYAEKIGLGNMARDIQLHVSELHDLVSTMPTDLQNAWALLELLKCQTQSHLHLSHQQIERVQRILARAKDTEFAKAMAKHRLECSSTLRWWISANARFPTTEIL
jgi:hypothetical protein